VNTTDNLDIPQTIPQVKTRGPKGGRIGRPPKAVVKKKNPVGRPKGDATIINEYKQRMLASPKSRKVIDAIFDAALDPEHKNQAAAWKLLMDRMLPVSAFEQEVQKNGGKSAITINISGIGSASVVSGDTLENSSVAAEDAEYYES